MIATLSAEHDAHAQDGKVAEQAAVSDASPRAEGEQEPSIVGLELAIGYGGFLSSWAGDGGGGGVLKLGVRLWDTVGLHGLTRLSYATVDQRLLTLLSMGLQVWPFDLGDWSPYLRVAGFHQHEESMAAVDQNPGGAVFGVGDGIRHRYGTEAALGTEYQLTSLGSTELYVAAELTGSLAFGSSGPDTYAGLYLLFGLQHNL